MKSVYKLLSLPLALTCCSAINVGAPKSEFLSFAITEENKTTLKLEANLLIKVSGGKRCDWNFFYIDAKGVKHPEGGTGFYGLVAGRVEILNGCSPININELKERSPVTLVCEVTVADDVARQIKMPYCTKTKDDFEISEATNEKELTTGYHKESTFIDTKKNYCYEDAITFLNFEDIRVNELYYDLDISYLRFKYRDGLKNTLKGDFRFAFYDRYNLFPDFEIGESMYRYIPLTLNKDDEGDYFTFAPTMYYDPVTHECGLTKKENYIETHRLMLPFNAAAELKFLPCYIELTVNSHTIFHIKGKFMMTYINKYFGDCADSEFCEELHQDDEINIREKVIEVNV